MIRRLWRALTGVLMAATFAAAAPPPAAPLPTTPPAVIDENVLVLDLSTGGRVTVQMRPDIAPKHVERIRTLVREGFYDGTVFHRVIDGFMAQGGDPTGTGQGGSKLPDLKAEFNDLPHVRGAVAMARAGSPDSANSQFYICLAPVLKLDHTYTVWGRVLTGMEYVDAIEKGEPPARPSKIVKASILSDHVPPPPPQTPTPPTLPPGTPTFGTPTLPDRLPGLPTSPPPVSPATPPGTPPTR